MGELIKTETITIRKNNLKILCRKANISLAELARKTGLGIEHLRKFDRNEKRMSYEKWEIIKNHLDKLCNPQKNKSQK